MAKKVAKKAAKKSAKKATPKKASSPASSSVSSPANMQTWLAKVQANKKFTGVVQVSMANEVRTPYTLRRSTGVTGLNIALGGGLHAGGSIEVFGEESAGKTYLVYQTAGELQRQYGNNAAILIFSTEIRPDKGFARKAGFHIGYSEEEVAEFEAIQVSRGLPKFTKEERADLLSQTGTIIYLSAATADVGLDVIIEALRDGRFQLVIIESLGAFLTPAQDEEEVGKRHYAGASMLVTNFQNKVYPLFCMDRADGSMLETTVIGINQARANMDAGMYGPKTKAAMGAHAWKHGQLASISLSKGSRIKGAKGEALGHEVRWKLHKGKAGTHDGKTGVYDFYHVPTVNPVFWSMVQTHDMGGIDRNADLIETAVDMGIVVQAGAWYSWEEKGIKGQGMQKFAAFMEEADLFSALEDECYKQSDLMVRFK